MNKLIVPMAVTMYSLLMVSTAFAKVECALCPPPIDDGVNGLGFEHSGNTNTCLNAGAGNGGEFAGCNFYNNGTERDPGQSQNNLAPEPTSPICTEKGC